MSYVRYLETLLYNYYPTNDNVLKVELLLSDDPSIVPVGSATINITNLLAKHKGYLYVPIITDIRQHLIKHRRSMPDLTAKSHRNLRADENPEFTRTPCFIIAATAIATHREHERRGSKIQQLTGTVKLDEADLKSNNQTQLISSKPYRNHEFKV